jgi:dihydrolipoamide dehydrogenase
MGGVCLNVGCIPSKSLLQNADVAHTLRERGKEFGFSFENLKLDFSVASSAAGRSLTGWCAASAS